MSATVKHIPTTSSANLDDYLGREKQGNDLPRVLYEAGQHCRPETAKTEFRALREEHGRQGETRTARGKYVVPDDPGEATHLKVGKNWRAAKAGETATHQRIEPRVPLEKRPEAFHFIYSFDLATVNPDDPEQCRRAFEAVVAFREQDTPGTQSKFVAHGDAHGSKAAIERGEGGKFHVHEAMNAVVHSDMGVDGRAFEAGQRVAGPITHVDSFRERWDRFLETRGHEFGLSPQDRGLLPEVGSHEYGAVRNTNKDFWSRENGEISDHDRARRGLETAFESLSKDPSNMAGLSRSEQLQRLADEVAVSGDVDLKLRTTKTGKSKLRSFVVPGRTQAIGATRLGARYDNDGLAEQLDLIARGQWKPYERPHVGPAMQIPELSDDEIAELQTEVDEVAQEHRRDIDPPENDVDEAVPLERSSERPHDHKAATADVAAAKEGPARTPEAQETRTPIDQPGKAAGEVREPMSVGDKDAARESTTRALRRLRRERQVGVLDSEQMQGAEVIGVVHKERADGGAYVDFQLTASGRGSARQPGLHLQAKRLTRMRDGRKVEGTRTWQQLTEKQYQQVLAAAGDNRADAGGKPVLAFCGNVMPAIDGGYTVNTNSLSPSRTAPIGSDVLDKQRASEDRAREREKERLTGSDRANDAFSAAEDRDRSDDRAVSL